MSRFERMQVRGDVSASNSSSTPLGAGGVFTGLLLSTLDNGVIFITVYSDVASATDGLSIQQSQDGTHWDFVDTYTIAAGTPKEYAINPCAAYLRVVYTNGSTPQTTFRLQTIAKGNSPPFSRRVGDPVTGEDDAGFVKAVLAYQQAPDQDYNNVDMQNPLPIDGDSVYAKDVWVEESDPGDFSGEVTDLFDNFFTSMVNSTSDNPKTLIVYFNRTVVSDTIALGADTGNFSNVKIYSLNSGGVMIPVFDESADNTDYTSHLCQLPGLFGFNGLKIEFHTADPVTISTVYMVKVRSVVSRIQAVRPDGVVADIGATQGGNLKVSIEEFETEVRPVRADVEGLGKQAVGTTAVEVVFSGSTTGVMITADGDNTGQLYIGKSDVTPTGANALTFLEAGESVSIDYDDSSEALYVVASAASQNFWAGATL